LQRYSICKSRCTTGINTGANFATGAAGVVDTGGKFASGVNDAGGKQEEQNQNADNLK